MAVARFLILLSILCCSYAETTEYVFCKNTSGTIIAELDILVDVKEDGTTSSLHNIVQNSTTSTCTSGKKRMFEVNFENDTSLKVIIENKNGTVFLTELEFKYESNIATSASISKKLSKSNEYYMCSYPETYKLSSSAPESEISVTFKEVKLQGFGVVNGTFSPGQAICADPFTTKTPPTPITTKKIPITTGKTPAPTNKTTPAPTTSKQTTASSTTNKIITTTTHTPSTTAKKWTTSTGHMTTMRPTTPSLKKPAVLDIQKNGTDNPCLVVEFEGALMFQYMKGKDSKATYHHVIDSKDVFNVTGSCDGDTPYVKGILSMGCAVEFRFSKLKNLQSPTRRLLAASFEYALTNLTVTYDTSKPPGAVGGGVKSETASPTNVKASSGHIYKCNTQQTLLTQGTTSLTVTNFVAGAYSPDRKNPRVCAADNPGNNVVPIVVGVILACLVVIIIVAYLIGRRRNREGYQSV